LVAAAAVNDALRLTAPADLTATAAARLLIRQRDATMARELCCVWSKAKCPDSTEAFYFDRRRRIANLG
jgi:hypothetical protein